MKKTILSFLCAAMLFGFAPKTALAAEPANRAAKLGIEKGDIVSFAGLDGAPIKWRVLDAEKSNVGDANGMLLLSENTSEKVAVNNISCDDEDSLTVCFKPTYTAFYDTYFADLYRGAVTATSVNDSGVVVGVYTNLFRGKLSDDTVFALSADEAQKLGVDERQFDGKKWILRSVRRRRQSMSYKYEFTYVDSADSDAKVTYAEIKTDNTAEYYFRPAVNVDKTALAGLDGKPLLLPCGEYSAAENTLAALGTASEWKLVQRDYDVALTRTDVAVKDNGSYTITVGTSLENPDGDDYISLIVRKSDGSISHYGRYAVSAAEKSIDLTLPSDVDKTNDTVYVFYEKYKGTLSGSAGELTKICLHEYDCTVVDAETHRFTCKKCGYAYDENHTVSKTSVDDEYHNVSCTVCGYSEQEEHTIELVETKDDDHTVKCTDCEKIITENHRYTATEQTDEQHTLKCTVTVCGYTKTENHTYSKITAEVVQKNVSCTGCGKQVPFMARDVGSAVPVFNDRETEIRTEYDEKSVSPTNCTINFDRAKLFSYSAIKGFSYIPQGKRGGVTFQTKVPIRAIGFRIAINKKNTAPNNIVLYGRKSGSSDEYKEIGSVFLKPILQEERTYNNKTYAFLFTDTTKIATYDDFKLEMDNDGNDIELTCFGLLSDKGSSFAFTLDGAVVDGYLPDNVYPGADLTFTLISKNGQHPSSEEIKLTIDGEDDGKRICEYNEETGVFTLPGDKIESDKEYILNVTCADKAVDVFFKLNGATVTDKTENIEFGTDYSCVFRDADGKTDYAPTKQDIQVLCGENDITANCTYTDYTLKIPGKYIIGDITITASEKFGVQKSTSLVKVERAGEMTRWYSDDYKDSQEMLKNINAGGDVTVTLVKNNNTDAVIISELIFTAGNVTLDLNGKRLSSYPITVGTGANLTIKNGIYRCTVRKDKNTVETGAVLTLENVTVDTSPIDVKGKLIVNNTLNQKTITNVLLQQESELVIKRGNVEQLALYQPQSVKIYHSTIDNISSYKDDTDTEVLAIDYNGLLGEDCEFYEIASEEAFNKGEPTGFSVRCRHNTRNVDPKTGVCICGESATRILTENDGEVILYDDIFGAFEYANQNPNTTVRVFRGVSTSSDSNIVLSGENITLDIISETLAIEGDCELSLTGSLTVTGSGSLTPTLCVEESGTLAVESGTIQSIFVKSRNVTFNGGHLGAVKIYVGDFSDCLGDGKAYKDTYTGKFIDLSGKEEYFGTVEVIDAPFVITSQPEDKYVDAGTEAVSVSIEVRVNEKYKDNVEYSWSIYKETVKGYSQFGTQKSANFSIDTKELDGGAHLVYQCKVSCDGYEIYSNMSTVTVGKGKPIIDTDADGNCVVDAAGNDCVLIAAAYSGERLVGTAFKKLAKESGVLKLDDILPLSEIVPERDRADVSEIKYFIWDSVNGMIPLSDVMTISNSTAQ